VGAHLLRAAGLDARATTNFDFVNYEPAPGANDCVVALSHRGDKRYGERAIQWALDVGARVVAITRPDSPIKGPEVIVPTVANEVSATHTASYTAALTVLGLVAVRVGEQRGTDVGGLQEAVLRLPSSVATILRRENEVQQVARALAARGRMVLIGAGPNTATAKEGALKVKESSYLVAEGFELETALHGGLQAVEEGDIAVVVAAEGPALGRTADLIEALQIIGARVFLIADERVTERFIEQMKADRAATIFSYPPLPEPLSPILAVVPLQLLAAFTANLYGTNADSFRKDQPVYKQAMESYEL
jgi:glucosamine--fructose-6-phosphate aminotransferase (isomerizing)